ncbi:MAG TPA: DNA-formamidopyrimidine glycosylase family protein, partial [Humidesulfovibrio sp.]|uniref:DNA-formamidopyrimidine glycosylase family protein n=1 Tax=Humidesulfovibrio sp. TaxID=2910988 RepID=UPI002BB42E1E
MPELPEVETIARTLAQEVAGSVIERVEVLDPAAVQPGPEAFAALVAGRRIESVGRRAKLLLMRLEGGALIAIHLRMTGR